MAKMLLQSATVSFLMITLITGDTTNTKFKHNYMVNHCNQQLTNVEGTRFETHTGLTYDTNMNCQTTISAPAGKRFHITRQRFDLERPLQGTCNDVFNMFDGVPPAAKSFLGNDAQCGNLPLRATYESTGNTVTFTFQTDTSANYRGFEFVLSAYRDAPCQAGEFQCNNTRCVDMTFECDHYDQCGDGSDEDHCTVFVLTPTSNTLSIGILVACILGGLFLLTIIAILLYKLYYYLLTEKELRLGLGRRRRLYEYPVTDRYSKYEETLGKQGRRYPRLQPYVMQGQNNIAMENERYLDEQ